MKKFVTAAAAIAAFGFVNSANAADITPVYKAAPAAVVSPSGYYVWVDGMYDRVRLPTYSIGLHNVTTVDVDAGSTVQSFDPSLNGGGIRGAIGYILPGTTVRFEVGGSYVAATGSNDGATATSTFFVAALLLNGTNPSANFFNCAIGFTCSTNGHLSTDYSAWQLNGKVAADWKFGSVTVTPSGAIFGGSSRAGQALSQTFTQFVGAAVFDTGAYAADTTLRWTDIGARVGLDFSVPLTPAFIVGLGGWVGFADRHTSLSGSDSANSTPLGAFSGASTISTNDSKGVFLANVEAGLAYKMTSMTTLRGFVGLNYDSSVPGITNRGFAGDILAISSPTPASIYYAHETSYYAGGGLMVRFGG